MTIVVLSTSNYNAYVLESSMCGQHLYSHNLYKTYDHKNIYIEKSETQRYGLKCTLCKKPPSIFCLFVAWFSIIERLFEPFSSIPSNGFRNLVVE